MYPRTLYQFNYIARRANLSAPGRKLVAAELRQVSTLTDRPYGESRIEVCDVLKSMGILLVGIQDVYTRGLISIEPIRANQKVKESIMYAYLQAVLSRSTCYLLPFNL